MSLLASFGTKNVEILAFVHLVNVALLSAEMVKNGHATGQVGAEKSENVERYNEKCM